VDQDVCAPPPKHEEAEIQKCKLTNRGGPSSGEYSVTLRPRVKEMRGGRLTPALHLRAANRNVHERMASFENTAPVRCKRWLGCS
jgi:hypothetical protein